MATITEALGAILGTIATRAIENRDARVITNAVKISTLVHETQVALADLDAKVLAYKAQSDQHALSYDKAGALIAQRLAAVRSAAPAV